MRTCDHLPEMFQVNQALQPMLTHVAQRNIVGQLITQQAVDIIMPDIPKCGGLSECRKIANLAEIYYIPFAPHNVASPIGTMASAHVCATIPNFLVIEFHWLHRDYWTTIIKDKEDIIKNGYITRSQLDEAKNALRSVAYSGMIADAPASSNRLANTTSSDV